MSDSDRDTVYCFYIAEKDHVMICFDIISDPELHLRQWSCRNWLFCRRLISFSAAHLYQI